VIILDIFSITGTIVYYFPNFLKNWLEKITFIYPQENLPDRHTGTHVGIVFGGGTGRIEKALELYKQGHVDYFLVTGGIGPYSENQELAEAEIYANYLIDHGVPDNHIWIENRSINTVENIKYSMERLVQEANNGSYGFLYPILITSGFHLKRTYALFEKALSKARHASENGCSIAHAFWSASPFSICEPETWRHTKPGCALVAKEAYGFVINRLSGKI
jgi:hypothetical protein